MMHEARARAKINLTLRVAGRRADGYHELASLVAFAQDAADDLKLAVGAPCDVSVEGPFGDTIAGENLIATALAKLTDLYPSLKLGAVHLVKRLPVAAGIGGGSADAAALLRCVRAANPDADEAVDWLSLAASLGADVPSCFANRATFMTGIGDELNEIAPLPPLAVVLVNPMVSVPPDKTAQVFGRLNAPVLRRDRKRTPVLFPGPFPDQAQLVDFISQTGNDLQAAATAVVPEIPSVLHALRELRGCRLAAMSGGGPTCFALFDDMVSARAGAGVLQDQRPDWWVVASELC